MQGTGHHKVTKKAFDLLRDIDADNPLFKNQSDVIRESWKVDDYEDVEFVDVEGGWLDSGRDDPHEDSAWDDDDEAHYQYEGRVFTPAPYRNNSGSHIRDTAGTGRGVNSQCSNGNLGGDRRLFVWYQ